MGQPPQESHNPRAIVMQIHRVILMFVKADYHIPEKMKPLYRYVEQIPVNCLSTKTAITLTLDMLKFGRYSAGSIQTLLYTAMQATEMGYLRELKLVEFYLRLDASDVLGCMEKDVLTYLNAIRDWEFAVPEELSRLNTATKYQLALFLGKHGFPNETMMVGPYALNLCDTSKRVAFEGANAGETKRRHLEALGWKVIEVQDAYWETLDTYQEKATYVRALLLAEGLLEI